MKFNRDLNIGLRIRELMNQNHDKVIDVACDINISSSQLRRLLRGDCEWSSDYVSYFSNRYQVPYSYIVFGENRIEECDEQDIDATLGNLSMKLEKVSLDDKNRSIIRMLEIVIEMLKTENS